MKKISLLSTALPMYLTELPVIYLLYVAIKYNKNVEGPFKLYPLILGLIGIAIFIFIYLFRVVVISYDTIKSIGPFSSKEKEVGMLFPPTLKLKLSLKLRVPSLRV